MDGGHIGRIGIDDRVRHVVARDDSRDLALPEVPGADAYVEPLPDRIGHVLREHRAASVVVGLAAGALAARFGGGGLVRRIGLGLGAAVAAPLLGATLAGALTPARRPLTPTATSFATTASGEAVAGREQLRVLTFNVREAIGPTGDLGGGEHVLDALAAEIERQHPDVVLLQEVTTGSLQGRWKDVPAELAERLHPTSLDVGWSGTKLLGFQKGNAVMTFGDARVVGSRVLQLDDPDGKGTLRRAASLLAPLPHAPAWATGYNARSALDTVVETGSGRRVRVVSTHLGGDAVQELQLDPLAAALGASDAPTILGGDFNTRAGTHAGAREADVLGGAGLTDSFTASGVAPEDPARRSFPSTRPDSPIDRIYTSEGLTASGARVAHVDSPSSDHLGLVTDVSFDA